MKSETLTRQLKEHALSHGIDLIGVTSAKPFVRSGRKVVKIDPREVLPDARSVIVTAFYMNEMADASHAHLDKDNPRGRFTHGYSMRAFTPMEIHYIKTIKGFLKNRGYRAVDNRKGRIPDKMAACRAGLGSYGKNSLIVTKKYGSYVMLVTLVTDAPLAHEEKDIHSSECGRCEACLRVCPTGAIYEPYRLLREQCVTAWLWGTFVPAAQREKQGNRIFGCGECVKVCPKNEKLAPRAEYPVAVENVSLRPELIPLVTGDREYCRRAVGSFPMNAGVNAIRGNAVIALGNIGAKKAVLPLKQVLSHPRPQMRMYAAWSLGRIGGSKARGILESALHTERNKKVIEEINLALAVKT